MTIRHCMTVFGAAFAALLTSTGAQAGESSTITIRVTIPPLAAALAARDTGAAGAWTIDKASGGLMIALPTVSLLGTLSAASETVTVYRSDRNRFTFGTLAPSGDVWGLNPETVKAGNGLTRFSYTLPAPATPASTRSKAGIIVSSI